MRAQQELTRSWKCPCILILLGMMIPQSYEITYEEASRQAAKMLSTSTPLPDALATTPKDPTANIESMKSELLDFLTLSSSLNGLSKVADMLTAANLTTELQSLIDVVTLVEQHYGFRVEDDFARTCSLEYAKEKNVLFREFEVLFTKCQHTLENVDILSFEETPVMNKITIHACSERARTIPADILKLIDETYQNSLVCAVESVKDLLKAMNASNYFSRLNENSMLLIKEMNYILQTYEKYLMNEHSAGMNDSLQDAWDAIKSRRAEIANVKRLVESKATVEAIENFKYMVTNLENLSFETNADFLDMSKRIQEYAYEQLKINEQDSLENWTVSPGIYKILQMNNQLRRIMASLVVNIPKANALMDTQQSLTNAKLFTGVSPTYGKACENSPHHFVGTCTPENHEVCRHVVMNWGAGGDQELLQNEELMLLSSLTHLKHCACGFRTDCDGARKGKRTTCFLMPNAEGHCRGGEGYPCFSHPLEVGMFDESCITGYCNRKTNSCELEESGKGIRRTPGEKLQKLTRTLKEKLRNVATYFEKSLK